MVYPTVDLGDENQPTRNTDPVDPLQASNGGSGRRQQQAARRAAEEQQAEESKQRRRKQERLERRRKRDEALFELADEWRRCETLRGFIAAVRRVAVEEVGFAEVDPKIAKWLVWAERVAGRHDPLERLRRSAPGRGRPR